MQANPAVGAAGSLSRFIGSPLGGVAVAFGGFDLVVDRERGGIVDLLECSLESGDEKCRPDSVGRHRK